MNAVDLYRANARERLGMARGWRALGDADMALLSLAAARFWHRCWIEQIIAERGMNIGEAA